VEPMSAIARFAGPGAVRALRDGRRGSVMLALSGGSAYLQLDEHVVLVAATGAPFGPLSVAVAGLSPFPARPGGTVAVREGALEVDGAVVSLRHMRPRLFAPRWRRSARAGQALASVLAAIPRPPAPLLGGLRDLACGDTATGARRLAGLGSGLTPLGDDVLAGYAAGRHALAAPVRLAADAESLVSPIGLAYLRCAERGELPEPAAAILGAVGAGESECAHALLPGLRRWGASSGFGLLWGIAAAVSSTSVDGRLPS
jgi:hypothetical protein